MAEVKFKIDETWNGIVINNTVPYEPGDVFEADESFGEGRPWLIKQPKTAKVSEKAKDEKKPKDADEKVIKAKAEEKAIKKIVDKKKEEQEAKKETEDAK